VKLTGSPIAVGLPESHPIKLIEFKAKTPQTADKMKIILVFKLCNLLF